MPRAAVLLAFVLPLVPGCACGPEVAPADALPDTTPCTSDDECDDGLFCTGIETCVASRCTTRPSCDGSQICDEPNGRCFTDCAVEEDADGDGARAAECGGSDCDDADPDRAAGFAEICDVADHDEDCDPTTFGVRDADDDDAPDARCCNVDPETGERRCGDDCDDTRAGVGPRTTEVCNGYDDDCDGLLDEGLLSHVYLDADQDGHGVADPAAAEERDVCDVEPGWSRFSDDCDDGDDERYPGNPEVCDPLMVDEDCSGTGNDVAGGCDCTGTVTETCGTLGACAGGIRTCDGAGRWGACSRNPSPEVCDATSTDDDCDGMVDESLRVPCYRDGDRDGYTPDGAPMTMECASSDPSRMGAPWMRCPVGFTARAPGTGTVDCCDSDGHVRPGAGFSATASACAGSWDLDCNGSVERDHGTASHTCSTNCTTAGAGWCGAARACGGTQGYTTSCWMTGSACYATSCWPTPMQCR